MLRHRNVLLTCTIAAVLLLPFPWRTQDDDGEVRHATGTSTVFWVDTLSLSILGWYISAALAVGTILFVLKETRYRRLPGFLSSVFVGLAGVSAGWACFFVWSGRYREELRIKPAVRITVDTAAILTAVLCTVAFASSVLAIRRPAAGPAGQLSRRRAPVIGRWLVVTAVLLGCLGLWRLSIWAAGQRDAYLDDGPSWFELHENEVWQRDVARSKAQAAKLRRELAAETDESRRALLQEWLSGVELYAELLKPTDELLQKNTDAVDRKIAAARQGELEIGLGLLAAAGLLAMTGAFLWRRFGRREPESVAQTST